VRSDLRQCQESKISRTLYKKCQPGGGLFRNHHRRLSVYVRLFPNGCKIRQAVEVRNTRRRKNRSVTGFGRTQSTSRASDVTAIAACVDSQNLDMTKI
jgi:hypothetical protein